MGTTKHLPDASTAPAHGSAVPTAVFRDEIRMQSAGDDFAHAALRGAPEPVAAATSAKIKISVVHGHLTFAKYPVMIGHYQNDAIAGSEAQLERAISPLLTDQRRLGLYPGPIASHTVVLDPKRRPCGAVVVGLGDAGDLSIGKLQRTLRQGLLAYMSAEAERRRNCASTQDSAGNDPASISTLLIGSYETGIDRSSCVIALLRAAADAQAAMEQCNKANTQSLISQGRTRTIQLREIEIIELLENRALDAWHIVGGLLNLGVEFAAQFELEPKIRRLPGAERQLGGGLDLTWWQPIQITMNAKTGEDRVLTFTVAGSKARAESTVIAANLDLVEPLMRRAIRNDVEPEAAASPGRALFELLWPLALKEQSTDDRNRRLLLDEDSARFPWELLDDRRPWTHDGQLQENMERKPQAVRSGLLRQLQQTRFREQVAKPKEKRKALVIGDPGGAPKQEFAELLGAQKEAKAVVKLLRESGRYKVTELVGRSWTPQDVVMHLFAEDWDIIHIAAHGVVREMLAGPDGVKREMTGVVLGGGVVLEPSALDKLLISPSLFFVNCCHLGDVNPVAEFAARQAAASGRRPELAANVAVQLIRQGAGAVVAAGWAVDDDAAELFATTFYGEMVNGETFGTATQLARKKAYHKQPGGNTWGAYQCYGEPDFRLPGNNDKITPLPSKRPLATPAEAIAAAERIRENVSIAQDHKLKHQRDNLDQLEKRPEVQEWMGIGELLVALAEARAELGQLEEAIGHYEKARKGDDTLFKIKAIEQLANLSVRCALMKYRGVKATADDQKKADAKIEAVAKIEAARSRVVSLADAIEHTQERWALQGGAWKRLAQVQHEEPCTALKKMAEAYAHAEAKGGKNRSYPMLMRCAAQVVLQHRSNEDVPADVRPNLERIASVTIDDETDFWQRIEAADARVLLAVLEGDMPDEKKTEITRHYELAWSYLRSPVKLRPVVEQFEFLEDLLPRSGSADGVIPGLICIRESMEAWIKAEGEA